jgi:RimJ/RimL family protein N-acetyltransferase
LDIRPVELEGERVRLVPMEAAHIPDLYEAGKDPAIWTYTTRKVRTPEDMRDLVEAALRAREQGTELPFVILDKESGRLVGSTRFLNIVAAHRQLEIGWTWLSPAVWRTRVNTECKYLLLRHCFETLGAVRVQLKTDSRNVRSQQAIERIGAVREGVLRRHMILPDGYIRDTVMYSITDLEWPRVKKRLEGMLQR